VRVRLRAQHKAGPADFKNGFASVPGEANEIPMNDPPRPRARSGPLLAGLVLLAACAAADANGLRATPVPLDPRDPSHITVGELRYLAGFGLRGDAADWGGLSGLWLAPDGSGLLAVSDLGWWLRARLRHDAADRLIAVEAAELTPLLDEAGRPLAGKALHDAEELARDADGSLLVAFERTHRLRRYRDPAAAAEPVETPAAMAALAGNAGIEAMAVLGDGRWVLLSEGAADAADDIRGWLRDDSGWTEIALARTDGFEATGLALLPDGDLLLLERRYTNLSGPAARLSVLPQSAIRPGARLTGREIAVLRLPLSVDNFEAVAARRATDGGTLVYLLSDDNRNALQRTLLLQFRLGP